MLSSKDYSISNAITWTNCLNHAKEAGNHENGTTSRVVHASLAVIESIPVIGQIASLTELATVHFLSPESSSEEVILQQEPLTNPGSPLIDTKVITLPKNPQELNDALFPFFRQLEGQYKDLPWPAQVKNIVVFTEVKGGRGDIAAAARVIGAIQALCKTVNFDWVLKGILPKHCDPIKFLSCKDPSKVSVRFSPFNPKHNTAADLLLTGPVKLSYSKDYISSSLINRDINGPIFSFMENAEEIYDMFCETKIRQVENSEKQQHSLSKTYENLHLLMFPNTSGPYTFQLAMGVQEGTGVFLDQQRLHAPLSRNYCCPSYLLQLEDSKLKQDILTSMNAGDNYSYADYDMSSFNSGYAHNPSSWINFIDCVAIHEKSKNVVVVLNQKGEFSDFTPEKFQTTVLSPERLEFLKEKGFTSVVFKSEGTKTLLVQDIEKQNTHRSFTVIVRPSFSPHDMRCMQLASERLLATGDNSAVESWCARSKLYLYEDVDNLGCKWRFLQQQVDLAHTISPKLGRLLALFGADRRIDVRPPNTPLNKQEIAEIEELLNDPNLDDATLEFCDKITSNYSFEPVLESSIKRILWHHYHPELANIEADCLDEEFRFGLINYIKDPANSKQKLQVNNLSDVGKRVRHFIDQNKRDESPNVFCSISFW